MIMSTIKFDKSIIILSCILNKFDKSIKFDKILFQSTVSPFLKHFLSLQKFIFEISAKSKPKS